MFRAVDRTDLAGVYDEAYFESYTGGDYVAGEVIRRHEAAVRLAWMADCGVRPPGQLLEVGAAAGYFVAAAGAAGWRARGLEPGVAASQHARATLGVDVQTGSIEDVLLEPQSLEAIVMWHVLEHLPDPAESVTALTAALRPGGHLLIEVPNAASVIAQRQGWNWAPLELDVHVSHFTPAAAARLLERCGLMVDRIETVPFLNYVPGSSRRALRWLPLWARAGRVLRSRDHQAHELLRVSARRPS